MKSVKLAVLGILAFIISATSWAQGHKPFYTVDQATLTQHMPLLEQSVDLGLPIYDIYYVVNSLGEFETERTGPVQVIELLDRIVDEDERVTFVYEVKTSFVGDEGSTGTLACEAYVTETKQKVLGYKPAICTIYEWDDERLWDE